MTDVFEAEQRLLAVCRRLKPHHLEALRKVVSEHVIHDEIEDFAREVEHLNEADLEARERSIEEFERTIT